MEEKAPPQTACTCMLCSLVMDVDTFRRKQSKWVVLVVIVSFKRPGRNIQHARGKQFGL